MSLKEYRRKRKFNETPEPKGKKNKTKGELRFVVQKHDATRTHYDFRLELDGTFKSWAIPKGPSLNPLDQRLAVRVEDHPLEYGSFEGIIPKGNYGAGTVMIWDSGTYRDRHQLESQRSEKTLKEGLAKGRLTLWLEGKRLKGEFALIKLKDKGEKAWLLLKKRDEYAKYRDVPLDETSAKSGRAMQQISEQAEKKKAVWHSRPVRTEGPRKTAPLRKFIPRRHPGTSGPLLTNLDKVFWPEEGYTKGDLIEYYRSVAPILLPHLKDRPESLNRFPNGIRGKSFFHKDMVGIPSWVPGAKAADELIQKDFASIRFDGEVLEANYDAVVKALEALPEDVLENLFKPMLMKARPGAVELAKKYAKTPTDMNELLQMLKMKNYIR